MGELADLANRYVAGRVRRGELSKLTARNHRVILASVTATYGDRPSARFNRRHIERWLETGTHLKASTRRSMLSVLRGFTTWLVVNGHLPRDPMIGIKPPRQPRTVPRAMPADDIGKLLRTVPDTRARAIIALAVGCGLRCCEISRLRVEDWDRGHNVLLVAGKGGHERELPVPEMVRRHLRNYLFEHPATVGPLIRSHVSEWKPIKPATISKLVSEWMAESDVKMTARDGVSAHALRHTAASDVLDECGDLRIVQAMLGHRNLATTSIYLRRANLPQMRNAMEGRNYQDDRPARRIER